MRRVIVPTDFSDAAWNAFAYGVELAKNLNTGMLVLNAYREPHTGASTLVSLEEILKQDSQRGMNKLVEKIESSGIGKDLSIAHKSVHLSLVEALNSQIKEHDEQVIVMGSLGESGTLEKIIGSNATAVIERAKCPVFVIPPDATFSSHGRLVYALSFDHVPESEDIALLKALAELNPSGKLDAVHVRKGETSETDIRSLADTILRHIPSDLHILSGNDVSDVLADYMDDSQSDLLVMVKKKRGLLHRIFQHNVIKEITLGASKPLLILKVQQD